jgi:hypothetical protein
MGENCDISSSNELLTLDWNDVDSAIFSEVEEIKSQGQHKV